MPLLDKPQPDFSALFEHAKAQILEYYDQAQDIADLFRERREKRAELEGQGDRRPSKKQNVRKLCFQIARELGKSASYVNQAKRVAETLTSEEVAVILATCETAEYVPCRETFISRARVPAEHRLGFIEAAIAGKWSAAKIKKETPESFGIRSNGRRQAEKLRNVYEAIAQAERFITRFAPLNERLSEATASAPEGNYSLRVTRAVSELGKNCALALNDLRQGLAAGAEIINDVTGLSGDPEIIAVARVSQAGVCAMHMQGTPQTMQNNSTYTDIVAEIHDYLRQRRDALLAAGIERPRICLDPGIGFGKTHEHNITLMANCHHFHSLGQPLLVGHSRKGFIGKLLGDKEAPRLFGTIGGALALATQGVQIIRVHDVRPLKEALALFAACGGV